MIASNIQLRTDITTSWAAANPILLSGEMGIESDTGKYKVGDGASAWNDLSYFTQIAPTFLVEYDSGSLPLAASYEGGFVWLSDLKCLEYSDGTEWLKLIGVSL